MNDKYANMRKITINSLYGSIVFAYKEIKPAFTWTFVTYQSTEQKLVEFLKEL